MYNSQRSYKADLRCFTLKQCFIFACFLDPDLAIDYEENATLTPEDVKRLVDSWQEHFYPVASLLLQHIEMHHTDLEPLTQEPD